MGRHRDKDSGSGKPSKDSKKSTDAIFTSLAPMEVEQSPNEEEKRKVKRPKFIQDMIDDWPRNKRKGALFMDSLGTQTFLITLLLLSLFITDAWTLGQS